MSRKRTPLFFFWIEFSVHWLLEGRQAAVLVFHNEGVVVAQHFLGELSASTQRAMEKGGSDPDLDVVLALQAVFKHSS